MINQFTTPCFIYKDNTTELRRKLNELGYFPHPTTNPLYNNRHGELHTGEIFYANMSISAKEEIDCDTNEALFLAIAALREDSNRPHDYLQWFTTDDCSKWRQSEEDFCTLRFLSSERWHKATVEELINHFKD